MAEFTRGVWRVRWVRVGILFLVGSVFEVFFISCRRVRWLHAVLCGFTFEGLRTSFFAERILERDFVGDHGVRSRA